ncbi:23S rRNA (adenine(2030)-N(6))-methyltransferase RlmJ [Litorivivens sp.]|uniref:23S rRNA (adenine(2030)-N(6))-methyltransferase RlmJ n=1 Tax=Litorivivens sp. TaxID=2020868 RepID=UPI003564D065
MLSYQHHYHAGNHADVLKHWLLLECVQHLQKKDKPFDYIDTHAGAGCYNLRSVEARKTSEAQQGVQKLPWAELPELAYYRERVSTDLQGDRYPGSPLLVARELRRGDRAWLFELHPRAVVELERNCSRKRVCHVRKEDGFKALLSLLPNASRRALVLIDPSYEVKSDYRTVVSVAATALQKMPQTMLLIWYPVVERSRIKVLEQDVKKAGLRNAQLFELGVADDGGAGMSASGLIAINPPWTLAEKFQKLAPALSAALAPDGKPRWRHQVLVPE